MPKKTYQFLCFCTTWNLGGMFSNGTSSFSIGIVLVHGTIHIFFIVGQLCDVDNKQNLHDALSTPTYKHTISDYTHTYMYVFNAFPCVQMAMQKKKKVKNKQIWRDEIW